jgi:hypothetical protein
MARIDDLISQIPDKVLRQRLAAAYPKVCTPLRLRQSGNAMSSSFPTCRPFVLRSILRLRDTLGPLAQRDLPGSVQPPLHPWTLTFIPDR